MKPIPQPIKAVLAMRRLTVVGVARRLGVSALWLGRVINGRDAPSQRIRQALTEHLGVAEGELFRPAAEWLEVASDPATVPGRPT